MDPKDDCKMFNLKQVSHIVDKHRHTIKRWVQIGDFPSPKRIGKDEDYWFGWQLRQWIYEENCTVSAIQVESEKSDD